MLLNKIFLFILLSVSIFANAQTECKATFASIINSTKEPIGLGVSNKIYNKGYSLAVEKLYTDYSTCKDDNGIECKITGKLAPEYNFTIEPTDVVYKNPLEYENLSVTSNTTISKSKIYTRGIVNDRANLIVNGNLTLNFLTGFNAQQLSNIYINGDTTIKANNGFAISTGATLHINGNVTIYSDSIIYFGSKYGLANVVIHSGSLTLIGKDIRLLINSDAPNIPHKPNYIVLAKDNLYVLSQNRLNGIFYSGKVAVFPTSYEIIGSITAQQIGLGGSINSAGEMGITATYDKGMVDNFCNSKSGIVIDNITKNEGNSEITNFVFTVSIDNPAPTGGVSVDYKTSDGTALVSENDYISKNGTVHIPEGKTSATITVKVKGDRLQEHDETFYINLSNPINATIYNNKAKGTIVNDDNPHECRYTFEGVLNSTREDKSIYTQLHNINLYSSKIYNNNNPLISKNILSQYGSICDGKPCVITNTSAPKYDFELKLGDSKSSKMYYSNPYQSVTISGQKEQELSDIMAIYGKVTINGNHIFNIGSGFRTASSSVHLNGDMTFKVGSSVYMGGSGSHLYINGNITIYAKYIFMDNINIHFQNGGTLTLIADNNYLYTGVHAIGSKASDFIILSKHDFMALNGGSIKALIYAENQARIDYSTFIGAVAAKDIMINSGVTIYEKGTIAVDCNTPSPLSITPENNILQEGSEQNKDKIHIVKLKLSRALESSDIGGSTAQLHYELKDGTAIGNVKDGKNTKRDYIPSTDSIPVKVGDTEIDIPVKISEDKIIESDEDFYIKLSLTNSQQTSLNAMYKVTILNDDVKFQITDSKNHTNTNIKTKIVNKSFNIYAYCIDENKNLITNNIAKDVQIRIKNSSNQAITDWIDFDIFNKDSASKILISKKADKNVKIELKWTNTKTNLTEYQTSIDNFAIRPNKFKFYISTTPKKAGENFIFKVKVLDNINLPINNYNEKKDISFKITYKEQKTTCKTGNLSFSKTSFINGVFNDKNIKYNNIGVLDINISEKIGSEFSLVDINDTPDSQRLITSDKKSLTFIPSKFKLNATLTDVSNKKITFYANDASSMGANLDINISAVTSNNKILTNYIKGCYSQDTNLTIFYKNSNNHDSNTIISNKTISLKDKNKFIIPISKSSYTSIPSTQKIKLNLKRDKKVVKNPSMFTISTITANDKYISSSKLLNIKNKAHFYYGRAHAPSPQETSGKFLDAKIYYEVYCKNCNKSTFTLAKRRASIDSVYWYILSKSDYENFGSGVCDYNSPRTLNGATPSYNNESDINITVINPPHSDKVYYTPNQTYLQYNRFGTSLPEHFFDIKFTSASTVWAGKGEKGSTVDTDISRIYNQSIEW